MKCSSEEMVAKFEECEKNRKTYNLQKEQGQSGCYC